MGQIKKFVDDINKSVSKFLGEKVDSYVLYQNNGVFSISLECIPEDSICIGKVTLLDAEVSLEGEEDFILSYVEFPVLGEKDDKVKLSLEDARKMIIKKLGTRRLKFIFENLK